MTTNLIVAVGSNVTVNIILSLPFITQTKMIIEPSNQVAQLWTFDTPPFPIDFWCAMCTIPVVNEARATANTTKYINIVRETKGIEEHIAKKKASSLFADAKQKTNSILSPAMQAKAVKFADTSINGQPSTVSIGSLLDPFYCKNGKVYADAINLNNVPTLE
jgi:hypothetical protein